VLEAYDPSYSGGRDQEDSSLKTVQANSSRPNPEKKKSQKRVDGVAQGIGPEIKSQHCRKKRMEKN
jgi:hypothetical protein